MTRSCGPPQNLIDRPGTRDMGKIVKPFYNEKILTPQTTEESEAIIENIPRRGCKELERRKEVASVGWFPSPVISLGHPAKRTPTFGEAMTKTITKTYYFGCRDPAYNI